MTGIEQGPDERGPDVEHDPTMTYLPVAEPVAPEAPARQIAGAFRYALVVDKGPRTGMSFVLGEGETTVGRDPGSDIFLGDVTVSRHHCRFVVEGEELRVEDLDSTNGTYVNGERHKSVRLEPDDRIIIGKFHLLVARGDV